MAPVTRRRLLHATAGVAAALAGCGSSSRRGPREPPERPENVDRDPDAYAVRNPDAEPVAWLRSESSTDRTTAGSGTTPGPREGDRVRGLVASREAAARLRFADVDGVEDAREFVATTDFDAETLYVETRRIRACHRLALCYVTWSATEIETQYGGYLRDADVRCDADAEEATTRLIRVPDVLDPDEVTGYGSGSSSNGCHYPPHLRTTTRTTTAEPMVGPASGNETGEGIG